MITDDELNELSYMIRSIRSMSVSHWRAIFEIALERKVTLKEASDALAKHRDRERES